MEVRDRGGGLAAIPVAGEVDGRGQAEVGGDFNLGGSSVRKTKSRMMLESV